MAEKLKNKQTNKKPKSFKNMSQIHIPLQIRFFRTVDQEASHTRSQGNSAVCRMKRALQKEPLLKTEVSESHR